MSGAMKPNRAATNEPLPQPGVGCIQDLVIEDLESIDFFVKDVLAGIVEDINARKALGIRKYGTALQAFNGRDAVMDAYQEALDLAMYLRQGIEEGLDLDDVYREVLGVAMRLRRELVTAASEDASGITIF